MIDIATIRPNQVLALMLCCLMALTFTGCGGCKKKKKEDESENGEGDQAQQGEVPPFEFRDLMVQPSQVRENAPAQQFVKSGHWITANKPIIANDYDLSGLLESDCVSANLVPIPTSNTNTHIVTSRQVPLAKGQWRDNEVTFYIPRREARIVNITLRHRLRAREGGRPLFDESQPVNLLLDYQYLMVVLAENPDSYAYLRGTNAVVHDVSSDEVNTKQTRFYRVITPKIENRVPLPSQALAWTSIAYLIWDNPEYSKLNPDQEQALIDWLHFGGQLVISGPNSLSDLRGSFLEPYLPVEGGDAIDLTRAQLDEMNQYWSIPEAKEPSRKRLMEINDEAPMVGIELELTDRGRFMNGTGELVAESQVGRGRIAVTGFPLNHRSLLRWKSFEGFLNGCLLRKPGRRFVEEVIGTDTTFELAHCDESETLPEFSTTLRYLSRDSSSLSSSNRNGTRENSDNIAEEQSDSNNQIDRDSGQGSVGSPSLISKRGRDRYSWFLDGYSSSAGAGMAGWNDNSGVSKAARNSLEDSAGITPPTSTFVRNVLICYLIVVVPLNWLIFRIIGRVEWAWAAVPVIAIVGAIIVVRMASLDIGFVRSRTEVAMLEIQGDHSRGHLTRYTAVYSSLSTGYDFIFDDISSQSQPFATSDSGRSRGLGRMDQVNFKRDRGVRLNDVQVDSASVRMVHSEQMLDVGGSFRLLERGGDQLIQNDSDIALRDVGLVRRSPEGSLEVCWIGEISAHSSPRRVRWTAANSSYPRLSQWDDELVTISHAAQAKLLTDRWDKDGDGMLTMEELSKEPEILKHFQKVDMRTGPARNLKSGEPNDGMLGPNEFVFCCRLSRNGMISLGEMLEVVTKNVSLGRGETRLIGWTDSELSGISIDPGASQTIQRTLVVVHLSREPFRVAERDENTWHDFNNLNVIEFDGEEDQ